MNKTKIPVYQQKIIDGVLHEAYDNGPWMPIMPDRGPRTFKLTGYVTASVYRRFEAKRKVSGRHRSDVVAECCEIWSLTNHTESKKRFITN